MGKLTKHQATYRYIGCSTKAQQVIARLTLWDDSHTIKWNANNLGISRELARHMARKYGLDYLCKVY